MTKTCRMTALRASQRTSSRRFSGCSGSKKQVWSLRDLRGRPSCQGSGLGIHERFALARSRIPHSLGVPVQSVFRCTVQIVI